MENIILQLIENDEKSKFFELWSTKFNEITELIESKIKKLYNRDDSELQFSHLVKILNFSIDRSLSDSELVVKIQKWIFKRTIHSIYQYEKNSNHSNLSLGSNWLLFINTKQIPFEVYQIIFTILQKYIQSTKPIPDELMEFWSLLMKRLIDKNNYQELDFSLETGKKYFEENFNFVIDLNWEQSKLIQILKIIIDLPLELENLNVLIAKINRLIPNIDWSELPPIIYHLLILSKKGCRTLILSSLIQYFNKIHLNLIDQSQLNGTQTDSDDENNQSHLQLKLPELAKELGVILIHFLMLSKQDLNFGSDIIKLIKSGKILHISPFTLALLLNLASIHRFQDEIMNYLKGMVLQSFREQSQIEKFQNLSQYYPIYDMESEMVHLLTYCEFGWDEVVQNLINLCILILDNAPKNPFGKVKESSTPNPIYTNQWNLGISILLQIFKSHEMFRSVILEEIVGRLYTTSSTQDNYIRLLSLIISECLPLIDQSLPIILSTVNTISMIPLSKIEKLIESWLPLLNRDSRFLSDLYIALRKGLFGRSSDSRLVSIKGLLQLLRLDSDKLRNLVGATTNEDNEEVFGIRGSSKDVLGLFKRCLDQPAIVKQEIYEGLQNPQISSISRLNAPIASFLYNQFLKYWNNSELPCIKFFECVNYSGTTEPIGHLLSTLFTFYKGCINGPDTHEQLIINLGEKFDQLVTGMLDLELRHLRFDQNPQFDLQAPDGLQNLMVGQMVFNVFEVLIEYQYYKLQQETETKDYTLLCALFVKIDSLNSLIRRSSNGGRGKRQFHSSDFSVLNFKTCARIFMSLIEWSAPSSPNFDSNLLYYLLLVTKNQLDKLTKRIELLKSDIKYAQQLFLTLWSKLGFCPSDQISFDPDDRLPKVTLETMYKLWNFLSNGMRDVNQFIVSIAEQSQGRDPESQEEAQIDFQSAVHILIDCITKSINRFNQSDASQLIQIILSLIEYLDLPYHSNRQSKKTFKKLNDWIKSNFNRHQELDTNYSKQLVQLTLTIAHQTNSNDIVTGFTKSIQLILETIQDDVEVERNDLINNMSSCFDERSCVFIISELLHWIESQLVILNWATTCLQLMFKSSSLIYLPSPNPQSLESIESDICSIANLCVKILIDLECSCIAGRSSELLILALTNMYRFLDLFTRYKIQIGINNDDDYIQLIKLTGTQLSTHWYAYIPWVQRNEIENALNKKESHIAKKKKYKSGNIIKIIGNNSRMLKEKKNNSNLTQSSEKLEHNLIMLKKRQNLDLTIYFKRSTTRDFRIRADEVRRIQLFQEEFESQPSTPNGDEVEAEEVNEIEDEPSPEEEEGEDIQLSNGEDEDE